jgi:predicted tellurium resistance membrane protein TerC
MNSGVDWFMNLASHYGYGQFFVKQDGRILVSPLFLVLLILESTDLVFAVDSVPAVLVITADPFIVFASNAFAIIELRSMFFALEGIMKRFRYLRYGLSGVSFLSERKCVCRILQNSNPNLPVVYSEHTVYFRNCFALEQAKSRKA